MFLPVYCLRSDIDISSLGLTGMKQSGLCVRKDSGFEFRSTDSYSMVEDKLRAVFPKLFDWIAKYEPDDATTSSWLICMKSPYSRRSLIVYSDDQDLPTGSDIITACQLSRGKVGVQNRVLYLGTQISFLLCGFYFMLTRLLHPFIVTREPVPSRILMTWRPSVVSTKGATSKDFEHALELEDTSLDEMEDESIGHSLDHRTISNKEDVQTGKSFAALRLTDGLTASPAADEDWDKPAPVANAPTPPSVDTIHDPFNSSLNFLNDENPWAS